MIIRTKAPVVELLLSVVLMLAVTTRASSQQLSYQHTAFVHGFGSGSAMWTTQRTELGGLSTVQYLAQYIELGQMWLPSWDPSKTFDVQWQNVRDSVTNKSTGRHVLVGHSTGGLVSRYAYRNGGDAVRNGTAAILTIASPHQGAILADSSEKLAVFVSDLKKAVDAATPHIRYSIGLVAHAVLSAVGGTGTGTTGLMRALYTNFGSVPNPSQLLAVATLPALRTTSQYVTDLNQSGAFDATVPRANIMGQLTTNKFVAMRLAAAVTNQSEQGLIDKFQKARSAFNFCKNVFAFTVIGLPSAVKCAEAERMMGRVDDMWLRYSNGTASQQQCGYVFALDGPHYRCWHDWVARNIPTDGVVPNERSQYPSRNVGAFWEAPPVTGTNHMTVYRRQQGVNAMLEMMQTRFQMRPRPVGFSATISGTQTIGPYGGCSWWADVTGGASPYTFSWTANGNPVGDGSQSLYYSNQGFSFDLEVLVTDANGSSATGTLSVLVMQGYDCS